MLLSRPVGATPESAALEAVEIGGALTRRRYVVLASLIFPAASGNELSNPLGHGASGYDRVAERDAITEVAGEEHAWVIDFEVVHDLFETSETDLVLRNGPREGETMNERGFTANTEEFPQVRQRQCDLFVFIRQRQFGRSRAAEITCQQNMPCWRTIGKERRTEYGSQQVEPFHFRNEHPEAIERMRDILPLKTQHQARDSRVVNIAQS